MAWIKNNLSRLNLHGVPDNMKMMANMKTAMMCGHVQKLLNKRKEAPSQPPAQQQAALPTPATQAPALPV
jgi:hypothetical protein